MFDRYAANPHGLDDNSKSLASLLSLYSLLIWIRIILSWLKTGTENPLAYYLGKIVDPYLSWFKGIRSLVRPGSI